MKWRKNTMKKNCRLGTIPKPTRKLWITHTFLFSLPSEVPPKRSRRTRYKCPRKCQLSCTATITTSISMKTNAPQSRKVSKWRSNWNCTKSKYKNASPAINLSLTVYNPLTRPEITSTWIYKNWLSFKW